MLRQRVSKCHDRHKGTHNCGAGGDCGGAYHNADEWYEMRSSVYLDERHLNSARKGDYDMAVDSADHIPVDMLLRFYVRANMVWT